MDYQFKINMDGLAEARFSMGHEAIGRWFSEELATNQNKIQQLLDMVTQVEQQLRQNTHQIGHELELHISREQVQISALEFDPDIELPEDMEQYEHESNAECGLPDFKVVLQAWQEYTKSINL